MIDLKGVGVALVTPFKQDLSIDFESLERLLKHTAEGGVDYWVVMGTTAEASVLSKEEKRDVLEFVRKHNPNNLPIIYGIGANDPYAVLNEIENTDLSDVSGILSVSPYYNKPGQAGIIKHYELIADKSPLPLVLYNVPSRTGSNMTASTTLALAQHSNIIATKDASGSIDQCIDIARNKPADFQLVSGDDLLASSIISVGGIGVISVIANAFARQFTMLIKAALEDDGQTVRDNTYTLYPFIQLAFREGNPVGVKQILSEMGVSSNEVRLPNVKATSDLIDDIEREFEKMRKK